MSTVIIYLIKVNIAIALFLLFYRLFFSGDTLWKARRIYLNAAILMAAIYPMLSLRQFMNEHVVIREFVVDGYVQLQELIITPEVSVFNWGGLLMGIYALVVMVLILRILVQTISIIRLHSKSHPTIVEGIRVRSLPIDITPFSFLGTIYLNPDLHSADETRQILTHEMTHVQQLHSIDVLISELLCAIFWINPAVWLLRKEVRQNLEFLADDRVLTSGIDTQQYQFHLLQLSCQLTSGKLTNQFNISPLKKRIIMMNQPRSSKTTALKYLLIAPLLFSLIVISNAETMANSAINFIQQEPASGTMPNEISELHIIGYASANNLTVTPVQSNTSTPPPPPAQKKEDDQVFVVVEEMPHFPGGDSELFKYLSNSIRYPVAAQEAGIQGRVICQFVVDKDGSITDVTVVRSVDVNLDNEAIRVLEAMPKWIPGKQRGETVRVKYTLPLNFALQGNSAKQSESSNPLIVIDGKIMQGDFDLNSIDKDQIEEVSVLKDAAAKELYGERGAKGVILIKMKK